MSSFLSSDLSQWDRSTVYTRALSLYTSQNYLFSPAYTSSHFHPGFFSYACFAHSILFGRLHTHIRSDRCWVRIAHWNSCTHNGCRAKRDNENEKDKATRARAKKTGSCEIVECSSNMLSRKMCVSSKLTSGDESVFIYLVCVRDTVLAFCSILFLFSSSSSSSFGSFASFDLFLFLPIWWQCAFSARRDDSSRNRTHKAIDDITNRFQFLLVESRKSKKSILKRTERRRECGKIGWMRAEEKHTLMRWSECVSSASKWNMYAYKRAHAHSPVYLCVCACTVIYCSNVNCFLFKSSQ